MQALYPTARPELGLDDLVELYDYPRDGPWVRANFVTTLDGTVQGPDLRSGSISDAADREVMALLRSLADVVLVGAGTARTEQYEPVQPKEVHSGVRRRLGLTDVPALAVVSNSLALAPHVLPGDPARTLVVTSGAAPRSDVQALREHADVIVAGDAEVDVRRAIGELAARGHRRVLTEGGPQFMSSFIAAGRCDELCLTLRSLIVGGAGYRMLRGPAIDPPEEFRLAHLLEARGTLFCRYTRTGD